MNKIFTYFLTASLIVVSFLSFAQEDMHFNCGLGGQLKQLFKENPDLERQVLEAQEAARLRDLQKTEVDGTTVYTVPVVFHILHYNGSEDISDAQVYSQMEILNKDYSRANADTSAIIPIYKNIAGDAKLVFKLATKDPWGNCTNGIEHIYTHLTENGDDDCKVNQWDRSKYLNVWVVKTIGEQGVAGYSFYPSSVDLNRFYADGVIILNQYIGNIGTGSDYNSRALTHEIGHWLNLAHPWGNTNDPGVACGDDGVTDTPVTKGRRNCNVLIDSTCQNGVIENVQNFMDYSYCSKMFTKKQIERMRTALTDVTANRSNLITPATHAATGIDVTSPPTCTPEAFFKSDKNLVCQGSTVTFTDRSFRATVTERLWTFEGGEPATSTSANPTVTYNTAGFKKVSLKVTNSNGSDELIKENYLYVSPNYVDFYGPYFDSFEDLSTYFIVQNPEDNYAKFTKFTGAGYSGNTCYKLNNYRNVGSALQFTDEWFYAKRLGGSKDALISNSYDLSHTTNVTVSFKYAYATNATAIKDMTENVKVYVSKDCGATWTLKPTLVANPTQIQFQLLTAGNAGNLDFVPTSASQWKECSFTYTPAPSETQTRFKIEFTASDFSNNFYVDDFNVSGTLGLFVNELNSLDLNVYPNPSKSSQGINVAYHANENPVDFILRDIQGKIVHSETIDYTNVEVNQPLKVSGILPSACYFLEVKSGSFSETRKVIVLQ